MTISPVYKAVIQSYLHAFTAGDLAGVLSLFAENALVHSPTQEKPKPAAEFYPALFERTKGSMFAPKSFFAGEQPGRAAVLFDYRKPLSGGGMHVFDCVDIFDFDAEGKIKEIWIIFDAKNLTKT